MQILICTSKQVFARVSAASSTIATENRSSLEFRIGCRTVTVGKIGLMPEMSRDKDISTKNLNRKSNGHRKTNKLKNLAAGRPQKC